MRIACVQIEARSTEEESLALEDALERVDEAASEGADLVLLPEAVWPGYILGPWLQERSPEEVAARSREVWEVFSRKSRERHIGLAAGMLTVRSERYYNSLVLFGPRGEELGRGDKRFLWHFDRLWFTPGETVQALDTPWGTVGLLVCADARIPEITRTLVRQGAWLILDGANLVSAGGDLAAATNQQVEFILSSRARENGVYLAMANKVGLERDAVLYCGRSSLWNPRGELLCQARNPQGQILYGEADPSSARQARREISFPRKIWHFLGEVRDGTILESPRKAENALVLVGMVQKDWSSPDSPEWLERALWDLHAQGASLVLLPPFTEKRSSFEAPDVVEKRLRKLSGFYPNLILVCRFEKGEEECSLVLVGGEELAPLPEVSGVELFSCSWGRFALLWGNRGEVPEYPRAAALEGADILLWGGGTADKDALFRCARTRAAENRLFVALAGEKSGAALFGPGGEQLARGLEKRDQAVLGSAFVSLARLKEFVPGTDAIRHRNPGQYAACFEEEVPACETKDPRR